MTQTGRSTRRRTAAAMLAIALAGVPLAACGGGGSSTGSDARVGTTATTASSGTAPSTSSTGGSGTSTPRSGTTAHNGATGATSKHARLKLGAVHVHVVTKVPSSVMARLKALKIHLKEQLNLKLHPNLKLKLHVKLQPPKLTQQGSGG